MKNVYKKCACFLKMSLISNKLNGMINGGKLLILCAIMMLQLVSLAQESQKVYYFKIDENIAKPALRKTEFAIKQSELTKADYLFLHLNTFGGELESADKIRTLLLNSKIPVIVFVDKNAASAGALISIACDSIYMAPGSSIGAASVVDQQGNIMPDKYQSYMRSLMRATAESNGRDPQIAQAMVDPDIYIPGISDSGKVLTFTAEEAIANNFCEAECNDREEVLQQAKIGNYTIEEQQLSWVEKLIMFLINPAVSGLLIMAIVGGIYFEMQSPGIGFSLIIAVVAALLYFAPHYLGGLVENWELLLFFIGLILLILELFLFPGFGVCGISGIILMVASLVLSLIFNIGFDFSFTSPLIIFQNLFLVLVAIFFGIVAGVWLGKKLIVADTSFGSIALKTELKKDDGYLSQDLKMNDLVGKTGVALSTLRPSGKVEIEGEVYDAIVQIGYIEKGSPVKVVKFDTSQLTVVNFS